MLWLLRRRKEIINCASHYRHWNLRLIQGRDWFDKSCCSLIQTSKSRCIRSKLLMIIRSSTCISHLILDIHKVQGTSLSILRLWLMICLIHSVLIVLFHLWFASPHTIHLFYLCYVVIVIPHTGRRVRLSNIFSWLSYLRGAMVGSNTWAPQKSLIMLLLQLTVDVLKLIWWVQVLKQILISVEGYPAVNRTE